MKMGELQEKMEKLGISEESINEVLFVAKRMDDKGLVNSFAGNISTKKDGKIYITPTGQNKALLTAEKVAVIDENGDRIWGMKETSEIIMHTMAYDICEKNGWNVGGVVHCHSNVMTAFPWQEWMSRRKHFRKCWGTFIKFPVCRTALREQNIF